MNRKAKNNIFKCTTVLAVGVCCVLLFFLFGVIIYNGISSVSVDFFFSPASDFGAGGGVFYQILGSLLMVFVAALLCFPIALGIAIYKSEYLPKKWQKWSTMTLYILNGIPSILFGIFGLIFFVNILNTGISWFVGSIILAIMILPTVSLAAYQRLNSVPTNYRDSAYALGLTKWQTVVQVLLPHGINGATTGLLIGLARAVGETAPIMFIATAFSGVEFPGSLLEPVSSLPTHILALAQQATNPIALQNAWGASFILLTLVVLFSISALIIRIRFVKYKNL